MALFLSFRRLQGSLQRSFRLYSSSTVKEVDGKMYFFNELGKRISPWHDIPLLPLQKEPFVCQFICEIPKGERAKFEIDKELKDNPIVQDKDKNGDWRFLKKSGVLHNYGAIPQTWEDPVPTHLIDLPGDDDPLDALDIAPTTSKKGDVYSVNF